MGREGIAGAPGYSPYDSKLSGLTLTDDGFGRRGRDHEIIL